MPRLEKHRDETFKDSSVRLDHKDIQGCRFIRCELVYGGGPQIFKDNALEETNFILDGSAMRTMRFLAGLYQTGAQDSVEDFLDVVRGEVD